MPVFFEAFEAKELAFVLDEERDLAAGVAGSRHDWSWGGWKEGGGG